MADWRIREATDAHEAQALDLLARGLNLPRFDREFWDWRYRDAPPGKGIVLVAEAGGRVIGVVGAIPFAMLAGDQELLTYQGVDSYVDADYRGRGVFAALGAALVDHMADRGGHIAWAFTSPMSHGAYTGKLGYRHVTDVPYWVTPTGVSHPGATHIRRGLLTGAGCLAEWLGGRRRLRGVLDGLSVRTTSDPADLAVLAGDLALGVGPRLHVVPSPEFLDWRFRRHPWHPYDVRLVGGDQPTAGIITRGQNLVLMLASDSDDSWRAAIAAALETARDGGAGDVHAYLMGCPAPERHLRKSAFLRWRHSWHPFGLYSRQRLVARALRDIGDIPALAEDGWHLQMAHVACGL
ncbi:MAG TPA: GNAT family N-acetyltransferase [Armatimonadota bacterium]|nr:GNAT family N-acetyltransferase [Armatimonadota bacterium]